MKNSVFIGLILLILLASTGCWDRRPVDELGIIANMFIEKAVDDNGLIELTIVRPAIENQKSEYELKATVEGTSITNAIDKLQEGGSKVYLLGAINDIFIGPKLAASGIESLLFELDHFSDFKIQAPLIVLNNNSKDIKDFTPTQQNYTALLIRDAIKSSVIKLKIPDSSFNEVMKIHALSGQEFVLPLATIDTDTNTFILDKMAVFRGAKMVGSIEVSEGIPFMIANLSSIDELYVSVADEVANPLGLGNLSVIIRDKDSEVVTRIENGMPVIEAECKLMVDINTYTLAQPDANYSMDKATLIEAVETAVSTYLEQLTKQLVAKTQQEFAADIFGFGEKVRVNNPDYYQSVVWQEVYPQVKISLKCKTELRSLGTVQ